MRRICSELLKKTINNRIMTRSDEMMLSAIRLKVAMQMNGRDVSVEGDQVKVALHGVPAIVVRFDSGDVRVNGMLKVSRKSAKVLNAVLRAYTDCQVTSAEGCWILEDKDGNQVPLTGQSATVPMTRRDGRRTLLESYIDR